ncbi:MAG: hypothetical protein ABI368_08715 [Jatrophihabitantaceae bacterium]
MDLFGVVMGGWVRVAVGSGVLGAVLRGADGRFDLDTAFDVDTAFEVGDVVPAEGSCAGASL